MFLMHITGTLFIVIFMDSLNSKGIFENGVIEFYKKYNFAMYLLHSQVIAMTIHIFTGMVSSGILIIINFIVSMVVSGFLGYLISKTRYLKKAFGWR